MGTSKRPHMFSEPKGMYLRSLRDVFENDITLLAEECEYADLLGQWGYASLEEAWLDNPVLGLIVSPSDLFRVPTHPDQVLPMTMRHLTHLNTWDN